MSGKIWAISPTAPNIRDGSSLRNSARRRFGRPELTVFTFGESGPAETLVE